MPADPNDPCARDGCTFLPLLTWVGDFLLPALFCSHACADFCWLERSLGEAPVSDAMPEALRGINELRRRLNTRREPFDMGPLVEH